MGGGPKWGDVWNRDLGRVLLTEDEAAAMTAFLALSDLDSSWTAASLSMRLAAATSRAMRSSADS